MSYLNIANQIQNYNQSRNLKLIPALILLNDVKKHSLLCVLGADRKYFTAIDFFHLSTFTTKNNG